MRIYIMEDLHIYIYICFYIFLSMILYIYQIFTFSFFFCIRELLYKPKNSIQLKIYIIQIQKL